MHDRQEDEEAAKLLEQIMTGVDSDNRIQRQVNPLVANMLSARMNFFLGEVAVRQHQNEKALQYFEKALAAQPGDADVLISLYRFPLSPQRRQKLLLEIKESVDQARQEIDADPNRPHSYNQLAWLVANTEGDYAEATRLSQRSIELCMADRTMEPYRVGGYLDTLAHCYYAQKDYARAVETQTEAVRLDPYAQAISRQLKVFKAALAKQQAEGKPAEADQPAAGEKPADGEKPVDENKPAGDKQP